MKILSLTPDDPFHLPISTQDLVTRLQADGSHNIVSAFVTALSPFVKEGNKTPECLPKLSRIRWQVHSLLTQVKYR